MNRSRSWVLLSRLLSSIACCVLVVTIQGAAAAQENLTVAPEDYGAVTAPPNQLPSATTSPEHITEPTIAPQPAPTPVAAAGPNPVPEPSPPCTGDCLTAAPEPPVCNNTVTAKVVAFDIVYFYNRFGAFNPAGMMYALERDVVGNTPGNVHLRDNKRPRPIVLRVNEGDCLEVKFTNLLAATVPPNHPQSPTDPSLHDSTVTRYASMHVNGLDYVRGADFDDGANVGNNVSTLVKPGLSTTYKWYAAKEGQYLLYSMGAPAGGEGDGGHLALGLFGSVNVEPKGASWYRSQVDYATLRSATAGENPNGTPLIDYEARFRLQRQPVLNMLYNNEIIYTDLNAIITDFTENCENAPPSSTCGQNFREFTVIFHDETKTVQAFPELNEELFHGVRDGFAINYGSGGLGAILFANRKRVGPAKDCNECKFEEFFLESHPNGDPAMIVEKQNGVAVRALFPDDPSNVHHSYLNDPVRFRNLHAGPKETHVFHLHAHQWLQSPRDENSTYLDSQTISPGGSFTYEINYGGSGNRNLTPGDAIFHCHLYPHFAQGMWELWRNHDVFENGREERNLPDAEIVGGTPNPAIIPIPDKPMPPMPVETFKGFPFYIAGQVGHRPPQPPYDMEWDGGLPRHEVRKSEIVDGPNAIPNGLLSDPVAANVLQHNNDPFLLAFARKLVKAQLEFLDQTGTDEEKQAIRFHQGLGAAPNDPPGNSEKTNYDWPAMAYKSYTALGDPGSFFVNGQPPIAGAPYADPCLPGVPLRPYRAAYIQFDMTVNKYGWHDRQARIATLEADAIPTLGGGRKPEPLFFRANSNDCITFASTNLVPNVLNLDDFQIFTPTDIIGQHIHLVKFDVTSSDGAGNGWNYEDGGFSPDEVRERIKAYNAYLDDNLSPQRRLRAREHPFFGAGERGEFLGAQTTIQRWWADPLLNNAGQDRTIRTVFTHDHFGPSSHQHHGLYAALVIEPKDSTWKTLDGQAMGVRHDGGPTSYAANIVPGPNGPANQRKSYREFNLAFADFAIVYTSDLHPVNPPGFKESDDVVIAVEPPEKPMPESISAGDPGTQLINYRNEPIPHRIGQKDNNGQFIRDNQGFVKQKTGAQGDMANVFSSNVHGDPFTPVLAALETERVQVRLIQGAQEEQHVFNVHGHKWLFEPSSPNSGFRNAQQVGISEHFEFEIIPKPQSTWLDRETIGTGVRDHLYSSAATDNLWDGQWGILRTYHRRSRYERAEGTFVDAEGNRRALAPLPVAPGDDTAISEEARQAPVTSVCPQGAPSRPYNVSAVLARDVVPDGKLVYNKTFGIADPNAIMFVQDHDIPAIQGSGVKPEPLIIRAAAGDCITLTLTNRLPLNVPESPSWNQVPLIVEKFNFNQIKTSNRVGLHPQLVDYDPATSDGANVGLNPDTTVGPNQSITYTWYAGGQLTNIPNQTTRVPIEFGSTNLRDMGDVIKHSSHGAIGALIIEPQGSTWMDAYSITRPRKAETDIFDANGNLLFREFVVLYQDDLSVQLFDTGPTQTDIGVPLKNIGGEDDSEDSGFKAFNYRSEPLWARLGLQVTDVPEGVNEKDLRDVLSSKNGRDPETPIFTAKTGTSVRFRVLDPAGHPRQHGFTVFGHHWQFEPWKENSTKQGNNPLTFEVGSDSGIGPTRHVNILTKAGGLFAKPGDYLYRTQESFQFTNGLWGIFRVIQ